MLRFALALFALVACSLDPPPLDTDSGSTTTSDAASTASPNTTNDPSTTTAGPPSCEPCSPAALAFVQAEDDALITAEQAPYLAAPFTMDAPGQVELLATGSVLLMDPIGPDAVALEYHLEIDEQPVAGSSRVLLLPTPGAATTTIATHVVAEVGAGEHSAALVAQGVLWVGTAIQWRQARALTVRRWE